MKSLSRDSTNDITASDNVNLDIATGKDAQAQIIEAIILTIRGELQLDTEDGVPYFDTVFQSPKHAQVWKAHVISRVMKIEFVDSVQSFDYDIDYGNHSIDYNIVVVTTEGVVKLSGNVER